MAERSDQPVPGTRLVRGEPPPEGLTEEIIRAIVDDFYAKARRDPVVGPVFNRVIAEAEWPHHLEKIADFWSSMFLGTGRFMGRPMPKHLAIPELGDAHFARWLALFHQSARDHAPPEIAALFIDRSERIANSFRLNIAMRRGEDVTRMGPIRAEVLGE